MATPVAPDLFYSVIATGNRPTNAFQGQLDITRTNQAGVMPCDVALTPPVTPITFSPVPLTNCQLLWGLLLDRLSPVATNIGTPFMPCPPATFGTRQGP